MKRIVRKEEGVIFTCLLPEGRMENGAMDSRSVQASADNAGGASETSEAARLPHPFCGCPK